MKEEVLIIYSVNDVEYEYLLRHISALLECKHYCIDGVRPEVLREEISRYKMIITSIAILEIDKEMFFYKIGLAHGMGKKVLIIDPHEDFRRNKYSKFNCYCLASSRRDAANILLRLIPSLMSNNENELWYVLTLMVANKFKSICDINIEFLTKDDFISFIIEGVHPLNMSWSSLKSRYLKTFIKDSNLLGSRIDDFLLEDNLEFVLLQEIKSNTENVRRITDKISSQMDEVLKSLEVQLKLTAEQQEEVHAIYMLLDKSDDKDEELKDLNYLLDEKLKPIMSQLPDEFVRKYKEATAKLPGDPDAKMLMKTKIAFVAGIPVPSIEFEYQGGFNPIDFFQKIGDGVKAIKAGKKTWRQFLW